MLSVQLSPKSSTAIPNKSQFSADETDGYDSDVPSPHPAAALKLNKTSMLRQGAHSSDGMAVDFSKMNLNELTSNQLEQLYIQTHCNNHIVKCPHSMIVTVKHISLFHHASPNPTMLKVRFRHEKMTTKPTQCLAHHEDRAFEFKVSYHALLFDTLKIDIFEYRQLLPPARLGRVRIRLNSLSIKSPQLEDYFNIEPKRNHMDAMTKVLGKIKLHLNFVGAEFAAVEHVDNAFIPIRNLPPPITIPQRGESMDAMSDFTSGSNATPIKSVGSTSLLSSSFPRSASPVVSSPQSPPVSDGHEESDLLDYIKLFESELAMGRQNSDLGGYGSSGYNSDTPLSDMHGPPALMKDRSGSFSSIGCATPTSPVLISRPGRSMSSSSNFSTFSTASNLVSDNIINSGSAHKRSKKKGSLFSERTRLGIKEFSELASAFGNFGWKISKLELARSIIFLQKYFSRCHLNTRTCDIVTDASALRVSVYWLGFSMATYGSLVMNYFGHGKGYLRDFLRVKSDVKTAIHHLDLKKEDMLVWEFGTGLEVFKPKFYICRDRRTDSIVVCFRGTFDVHDALTDLNAEYVPFLNGFVHRGFLRCARWVEEHYLDQIKSFISRFKVSSLYVIGHSLGGAIASLFTMILRGHLPELKACTPRFKNLYCYTHASPPSASANLSEEFKAYVDSYVNENDVVPRLSYGSVLDFRELIIAASGALKMKVSTEDKMRAIDMRHRQLKESPEHPKVYVVGNIYYVYKTSRMFGGSSAPPSWCDLKSPSLSRSTSEDNSVQSGCSSQGSSFSATSQLSSSPVPTHSFNTTEDRRDGAHPPLIDFAEKHYVVERYDKEHLANVHVRTNMLYHHFPNKYDNGLRKAHEWLISRTQGKK